MAASPKSSKDELLVENAILKYNEQVRSMLKQELAPFSQSIKELDKRLTRVEEDMTDMKDVMAPFSAIRKKIWFVLVAISLMVGILGNEVASWIKTIVK